MEQQNSAADVGNDDVGPVFTHGAEFIFAVPLGLENLPEELLAIELAESEKYVLASNRGIGAWIPDGGTDAWLAANGFAHMVIPEIGKNLT